MPRWPRIASAVVFIATTAAAVQFDAPGRRHRSDLAYNGQFTFVRLRWKSDFGFSRRGGFSSAWNHDYPRFGFEPASTRGLGSQWEGVPEAAFMVLVLDVHAMAGVSGVAEYRDEFNEIA